MDRNSRTLIGAGEQREGLYYLQVTAPVRVYHTNGVSAFDMWHRRMGHPLSKVVELLPYIDVTRNKGSIKSCDVCFRAKQCRDVFFSSNNKAKDCFDLIHCDLWGAYIVPTSCGAGYFLTIIDDCSRATWIYLLSGKDEIPVVLKRFFSMVKRQFDKEIKIVRSDNGTEFPI